MLPGLHCVKNIFITRCFPCGNSCLAFVICRHYMNNLPWARGQAAVRGPDGICATGAALVACPAVVAKTLCWDWVADMESAANRARNDDKQRLLILRPQRNMDRSCGFFAEYREKDAKRAKQNSSNETKDSLALLRSNRGAATPQSSQMRMKTSIYAVPIPPSILLVSSCRLFNDSDVLSPRYLPVNCISPFRYVICVSVNFFVAYRNGCHLAERVLTVHGITKHRFREVICVRNDCNRQAFRCPCAARPDKRVHEKRLCDTAASLKDEQRL